MEQLIPTFVHDHCGDNYAVVLHTYKTGPTITIQSFHAGSDLPNAEKVLGLSKADLYKIAESMQPLSNTGMILPQPTMTPTRVSP